MKRGFVLLGVALNAVMAVVGVDGTGGSSVPGGYGQLLRVHSGLAKPEHRVRFWKELDARPGAFNQLALFSSWTEGVAALETHRGKIGDFKSFIAEAHRRGYVAGVNILPGVAFPENFPTQRVAGARNRVNEQGQVQVGTLCLDSQVTRDYIRDLCALYAEAGADFIYLDDDVDLAHCCCPSCCARLSKLAGLDLKDAAAVRAARDGKDLAVRERVRNAWIDFADETRTAVFTAAAFTALVDRGFGEHLGFKIGGFASRRAGSRDLDHPLNLPGRRKRSIHYSLSSGRENRTALRARGGAFYAMNISTDEQRDLELALLGDGVYEAELFVGGVLKERLKLKPVARDGRYSIYRGPVLPNLGSVLLVPERMAR